MSGGGKGSGWGKAAELTLHLKPPSGREEGGSVGGQQNVLGLEINIQEGRIARSKFSRKVSPQVFPQTWGADRQEGKEGKRQVRGKATPPTSYLSAASYYPTLFPTLPTIDSHQGEGVWGSELVDRGVAIEGAGERLAREAVEGGKEEEKMADVHKGDLVWDGGEMEQGGVRGRMASEPKLWDSLAINKKEMASHKKEAQLCRDICRQT
ncbi:hypothetical protein BDK51DRAFT_29378 [Blyttiomyces helicus]|uniref:Uncharacterized protein n=1 Tax=Blyttiomyces helicus TaxID=388810 RepID=A0A4P9WCT7_9FUNG|nr:hypothetical protein BDK51DRAFT_29378 [Blyttiomyces helicus]|eukprot:RKO90471.1 hypothetical protein BDK51DRAFT_29378 [Blyttiomyces helicus]